LRFLDSAFGIQVRAGQSRRIGKDVRHTRCSNYMALRKGPIISSLFVLVKALPRQREGAISKLSCCRPSSPSSGLIQMLIISVGLFQSDRYLVDGTDHVDCDQAHLSNDGFEALSFEADRPFAADRFQHFLELLPDNVFRAKGMLWVT
jgi:hypothetical protein